MFVKSALRWRILPVWDQFVGLFIVNDHRAGFEAIDDSQPDGKGAVPSADRPPPTYTPTLEQ